LEKVNRSDALEFAHGPTAHTISSAGGGEVVNCVYPPLSFDFTNPAMVFVFFWMM
jgi:hypothetical protein